MKINGLSPFVFVDGKLFVDVSSATGLIRFNFFFFFWTVIVHIMEVLTNGQNSFIVKKRYTYSI